MGSVYRQARVSRAWRAPASTRTREAPASACSALGRRARQRSIVMGNEVAGGVGVGRRRPLDARCIFFPTRR